MIGKLKLRKPSLENCSRAMLNGHRETFWSFTVLRDEDLLNLFENRETSPAPHALPSRVSLTRISFWALVMEPITCSLNLRKEMILHDSLVESLAISNS
jgi:hypothetical protein